MGAGQTSTDMTGEDEFGSIVVDTATRIFRDHCDPQTINNAVDDGWKQPLWQSLEESGLILSWVPDDKGGAGVSIADGFEILHVSGRFAVPVPLAETMLAGWLLAQSDIPIPAGAMTVAPCNDKDQILIDSAGRVTGTARGVPFASEASHLVVVCEQGGRTALALIDSAVCTIADGASIAGDPRNTVEFKNVEPVAVCDLPADFGCQDIMLMGAAVRSRQMAGALTSVLDLSVEYAKERIAFERPIGKFQTIQHNLAKLAGEVAAAEAVSGSAADAINQALLFDDAVFLETASAKIRVGEAAGEGAAIAHQVFGAIGFTAEHILHRLTRRLWAWRDDFGSESEWAVQLGTRVAKDGADELWPTLAAR